MWFRRVLVAGAGPRSGRYDSCSAAGVADTVGSNRDSFEVRGVGDPVRAPEARGARWWLRNAAIGLLCVVAAPLGVLLAWPLTRWPLWVKLLATAWALAYLFFTLFSPPTRDRPSAIASIEQWVA